MRYGHVIVANPPNPPGWVSNKDSMGGFGQLYPAGAPPFPPMDIPYLGAYLRERGIPCSLVDANASGLEGDAFLAAVRPTPAAAPALLLVRTSLPTVDWDLEICERVHAAMPELTLAVFGPPVDELAKRIERSPVLSHVVRGEAEETIEELVRGDDLQGIPGLSYRDAGGRWQRNPPRPMSKDLDARPFPAWDMLPWERYTIPRSSMSGGARFLPMLSSRGCPYGCHYCPYPLGQGLPFRPRSPANVVDEMERLVRDFGVEHILFRDPVFSLNRRRVREICEDILARGLRVEWKCETRLDCLDPETIRLMAAAGCRGMNFGIESTDVDVQAGVGRKPITREEMVEVVARCRAHGIRTFCFFIIGLPGDTFATIMDTIRFAVELRPDWVQFTAASPILGTRLRTWAVERGLVADDDYAYRSSHETMMGNERFTAGQVRAMHRFALMLQHHVLNRHGLLKNARRTSPFYRAASRAADTAGVLAGRLLFIAGREILRRRLAPASAA